MYLNNYLAFFGAIRARHPHMRLVANCDMGQDAPTGGGCQAGRGLRWGRGRAGDGGRGRRRRRRRPASSQASP